MNREGVMRVAVHQVRGDPFRAGRVGSLLRQALRVPLAYPQAPAPGAEVEGFHGLQHGVDGPDGEARRRVQQVADRDSARSVVDQLLQDLAHGVETEAPYVV